MRGRVNQAIDSVRSLVDATKLIAGMRQLGPLVEANFANYNANFEWLDPVVASLDASPGCNANPVCVTARGQFYRLQAARGDGSLDKMVALAKQCRIRARCRRFSTKIDSGVLFL